MINTRVIHPVHAGFTLVETMVAITILVIAVVGPLYAVHRSVVASYTARDALAATALAQEGMEYVRSVRDSNYLSNSSDWLSGLDTCIVTGPEGPSDFGCAVDPNPTPTIAACASGGCAALRLDSSYRYRQSANAGYPVTRFARKVTISRVSSEAVLVTVAVSWSTLRIPYTVTVSEYLYNWQ
jgi:prepilin-type N-terminal cleavage/methylation domain-containing protein